MFPNNPSTPTDAKPRRQHSQDDWKRSSQEEQGMPGRRRPSSSSSQDEELPPAASMGRRLSRTDGASRTPFSYRRYSQAVITNAGMGLSPDEAIELYARRTSRRASSTKDLMRRDMEQIQAQRRQSYDLRGNIIRKPGAEPTGLQRLSVDSEGESDASDDCQVLPAVTKSIREVEDLKGELKEEHTGLTGNKADENDEPFDEFYDMDVQAVDPEEFFASLGPKVSMETILLQECSIESHSTAARLRVITAEEVEKLRSRVPLIQSELSLEEFALMADEGLMGGLPLKEEELIQFNGDRHVEALTDYLENYIIDPTEYYEGEDDQEDERAGEGGDEEKEQGEEEEEEEDDEEFLKELVDETLVDEE